jgi:hypothetical protein
LRPRSRKHLDSAAQGLAPAPIFLACLSPLRRSEIGMTILAAGAARFRVSLNPTRPSADMILLLHGWAPSGYKAQPLPSSYAPHFTQRSSMAGGLANLTSEVANQLSHLEMADTPTTSWHAFVDAATSEPSHQDMDIEHRSISGTSNSSLCSYHSSTNGDIVCTLHDRDVSATNFVCHHYNSSSTQHCILIPFQLDVRLARRCS